MYNQEDYIYEEFTKNYTDRTTPLVIYGIGINTKNLLPRIKDYNIVGLMDGKKKTGEIYGKPILDESDIVAGKFKKIIILARPAVIGMIFYRIADFARENNIFIGDIHGKDLALEYCDHEYDLPYYHKSWSDLEQACEKHKIITFDIFDTLLVRKTFQPKDIFELVEVSLKSSNEKITSFAKYRIIAEENLRQQRIDPNIYQIYDELQKITNASDTSKQKYLSTEFSLEKKFIISRQNMLNFFNKIKAEKEIYLISDMYFPKHFLQELLEKCGYVGYRDIYISCEYNCSKNNGLFERFISADFNRKNALHIGDNSIADGECARAAGLKTFEIMSEHELLENSVYNVLLDKSETILDRIAIGLFCVRALDDPFIFFDTKGKLTLNNHKDISYLFVAPEICYFSCWLMKQIKEDACDHVLYPSRDAYILKKICNIVKNLQNIENYPDGTYLYASRRALLAASTCNQNDIDHVIDFEFHGSVADLFQNRFNVKLPEEADDLDLSVVNSLSRKYKQAILERCLYEKNNYLKYLSANNINPKNKLAFIDFVAAGSVHNGLRKILPSQICGYYFLKKNTDNLELENELTIKSFYPSKGDFELEANIYKFYLFFELMLTSPEPTFNYMNEEGMPVFFPEVRSQEHIDIVIEMQEEILNFCKEIASLHPCLMEENILKEIPDQMVGFMGKKYSNITSEAVLSLVLTDEYFAATFNIFDR